MVTQRKRRVRKTTTAPLKIQEVPIKKLKPYRNNPRINDQAVAAVKASIKEFGFQVPMVVTSAYEVVTGHTRLKAMKELGYTTVPCVIADKLSKDQVKAFRNVDNKTSELADWDMDKLSEEITELVNTTGIDLTQFGWSKEEVDCLSDVVSSDCLSEPPEDLPSSGGKKNVPSGKAPRNVRFVFGDITFYVPAGAFRRWSNQLKTDNEFNENDINASIQDMLGLTPYIESEG